MTTATAIRILLEQLDQTTVTGSRQAILKEIWKLRQLDGDGTADQMSDQASAITV